MCSLPLVRRTLDLSPESLDLSRFAPRRLRSFRVCCPRHFRCYSRTDRMDGRPDHDGETTMHPQRRSNLINSVAPNQISLQRMRPDRVRLFLKQGLFAALLGAASAVPVMAAPPQLPAIVE